jgi:hypothetical protein
LRQTHVRVKNCESPDAIVCLGVWLTRRLPNKRAHCCTLHRRMATSRVVAPVCHPVPSRPGTGSHLCGNPTSPPCGAHGISACAAAIRLCVVFAAGRGSRMAHAHTGATCVYGVYAVPIPTCSAWIATAAQKLWSPGSPRPPRSPMLGAASRGPWGSARLLSLL